MELVDKNRPGNQNPSWRAEGFHCHEPTLEVRLAVSRACGLPAWQEGDWHGDKVLLSDASLSQWLCQAVVVLHRRPHVQSSCFPVQAWMCSLLLRYGSFGWWCRSTTRSCRANDARRLESIVYDWAVRSGWGTGSSSGDAELDLSTHTSCLFVFGNRRSTRGLGASSGYAAIFFWYQGDRRLTSANQVWLFEEPKSETHSSRSPKHYHDQQNSGDTGHSAPSCAHQEEFLEQVEKGKGRKTEEQIPLRQRKAPSLLQ